MQAKAAHACTIPRQSRVETGRLLLEAFDSRPMENNKILGIVLIAIGALLLLNWLNIPYLALILGILLLVVGIMIVMGKLSGVAWMGWTAVVLGALVILASLGIDALQPIAGLVVTLAAIILIVIGVLKLLGKM